MRKRHHVSRNASGSSDKTGTWYRDDQLRAAAKFLANKPKPSILLGDLNVTPWSSPFQHLLRQGGLRDTAIGFGIHPTWPSYLWPMRIPIDHCLVSPGLRATKREVGRNVGSDHFPLLIELEFESAIQHSRSDFPIRARRSIQGPNK